MAQRPSTLLRRSGVPTCRQHDVVLDAVKAWPVDAGACGSDTATASLDRICARRPAGRQVGTKKRYSVEQRNCTKDARDEVYAKLT
jgi:hypothetical protein